MHAERGEQVCHVREFAGAADPDRTVTLGGHPLTCAEFAVHLGTHLDERGVQRHLGGVQPRQRRGELRTQLPRLDACAHRQTPPLGYSAAMSEPLDDIDRVLARELVADGRATLAHLAETAGLSVSAVQSRVRRLESRGVVTGYTARINPEAVGKMLSAFVAITPLDPSQPDDAPARLEHIPAIVSCYSVAGEESYILLVRVETPRALEDLLQQIRTAANVRTRSTVILQTFYDGRDYVP